MDIDLSVLRLMEREREIPFDELVRIIEQAILTAYLKHTGSRDRRTAPQAPRRAGPQDRPRRRSSSPQLDEDGDVIGEAEDDARRLRPDRAPSPPSRSSTSACATSPTTPCSASSAAREGDIVAGVIQQGPNPRMIHVDLGTVEAILPPEEQVAGEEYTHGSRIRVYVTSVEQGHSRARQITVSPHASRRSSASCSPSRCPRSPAALVEIVSLAREAGHRTKIAVRANEPGDQRQGRLHRRARPARARGHRRAQQREDRHRRLRPPTSRRSSRTRCRRRRSPRASSSTRRSRRCARSCPTTSCRSRSARRARTPGSPPSSPAPRSTSSRTSILEEGARVSRRMAVPSVDGVTWILYEPASDAARVLPGPPS